MIPMFQRLLQRLQGQQRRCSRGAELGIQHRQDHDVRNRHLRSRFRWEIHGKNVGKQEIPWDFGEIYRKSIGNLSEKGGRIGEIYRKKMGKRQETYGNRWKNRGNWEKNCKILNVSRSQSQKDIEKNIYRITVYSVHV